MRVSGGFVDSERVERQAPPPHPSPLKGEGVGGGVGLATAKPLRDSMPIVTEFIDACREAFGVEPINASIKAGLAGSPTFWASENGLTVGSKS